MIRRFWSLLFVLVASSLVMTATVHARELPGLVAIECSGTVHSDADGDQTQGDAESALPHHHGTCHGQALDVPATDALAAVISPVGLRMEQKADHSTASYLIDPALRPPTA